MLQRGAKTVAALYQHIIGAVGSGLGSIQYLFKDLFVAGSMTSPRTATPGPGTEVVVDGYGTNNGILNPGYESVSGSDFANWTELVGNGAIAAGSGADAHSGTYGCKLTAGASANTWVLSNVLYVQGGRQYTWTFWTKGDGTNAGRYWVYDITNATGIGSITTTGVTSTTWTQVTVTFTAPATCYRVYVYCYCPTANGGVAVFDDHVLVPTDGGKAWATPSFGMRYIPSMSGTGNSDPMLSAPSVTRVHGVALGAEISTDKTDPGASWTSSTYLGWSHSPTAYPTITGLGLSNSGNILSYNGGAASGNFAVRDPNSSYGYFVIMRPTGAEFYMRVGSVWKLIWIGNAGTATPSYPTFSAPTASGYLYKLLVPRDLIRFGLLAYDNFTRTDGGIGKSLSFGPDGQSASIRSWIVAPGTGWIITSNAAYNGDPSGAFKQEALVEVGATSVIIDAVPVYVAGAGQSVGIIACARNYISNWDGIRAYFDGSGNIVIDKRVNGSVSTLATVATTYSAGKHLVMIVDTSSGSAVVRVFYNDVWVGGAEYTVSDSQLLNATKCGMYCNNSTDSFTSFSVRARGLGGEYAALTRYLNG